MRKLKNSRPIISPLPLRERACPALVAGVPEGRVRGVWAFIFFMIMSYAYALPTDKNQPVHITADTAHLDKSTGISVFQGRVKLTQGTSILTTEKLTVYLDKNN